MWTQITHCILRCIYKFKCIYIYKNKYIIFKSTERSFWRARLEVSILSTHVGHIHQTSNQSKGDKTNCSSSTGSWKLSFCRCDSPRVLLAWLTHGDYMHLQPHSSMPWRFKMGQDRETLETYYGRITFKISEHVLWTPTVKYIRIHTVL